MSRLAARLAKLEQRAEEPELTDAQLHQMWSAFTDDELVEFIAISDAHADPVDLDAFTPTERALVAKVQDAILAAIREQA